MLEGKVQTKMLEYLPLLAHQLTCETELREAAELAPDHMRSGTQRARLSYRSTRRRRHGWHARCSCGDALWMLHDCCHQLHCQRTCTTAQ